MSGMFRLKAALAIAAATVALGAPLTSTSQTKGGGKGDMAYIRLRATGEVDDGQVARLVARGIELNRLKEIETQHGTSSEHDRMTG